MEGLNWLAIAVVTVGTWMFGAVWFGPVWGKVWMRIHHGDKKFSDAENKEMMKGMWKLLVTEFIASVLMVIGLALIIHYTVLNVGGCGAIENCFVQKLSSHPGILPEPNTFISNSLLGILRGFYVWLAFVFPAGVSVVLWGADEKKWMCTKIALIASNRLIGLLAAGYILSIWK